MEKEINVSIHNRFDIIKRDAKTGKILGEWKAENIILNAFWGLFLSANNSLTLSKIRFGSGTSEPVVTDTNLTTPLGTKTATAVSTDTSTFSTDGTIKVKKTIRLESAEYIGSNISEVGFVSSYDSVMTKALVKDMNGNVVTIIKGDADVIDIFATFYVKTNLLGWDNGNIFICSAPQPFLFTTAFNTNTKAYYLTHRPGFNLNNTIHRNTKYETTKSCAYDAENKKATFTVANLTATIGNLAGGLRGLQLSEWLALKLPFTNFAQPVLTKEVLGTGDGTKKDFAPKFGYIKNNGTCKLFVNDVEVSATIDYNMPAPGTEMLSQLNWLGRTDDMADGSLILENPFNSKLPIESFTAYFQTAELYASEDAVNWIKTASGYPTLSTGAYSAARYFKFVATNVSTRIQSANCAALVNFKPVHLASAPAAGDTVSITYQPDCIAKDDQHVLNNVIVTMIFGEYTPT